MNDHNHIQYTVAKSTNKQLLNCSHVLTYVYRSVSGTQDATAIEDRSALWIL